MGYKSCILTAIKDEREYLEEWIKYHLDFGIDYICIIEDYDSESHKDITDKFGDKVELVNAREFLNEESFKMALHLKTTRGCNPQHLYFNVPYGDDDYSFAYREASKKADKAEENAMGVLWCKWVCPQA